MSTAETQRFIRLRDGTILLRQPDGTYSPVETQTDWARLDALTEEEIEWMAANDPDHPALDDAFWAQVDERQKQSEVISIRVDGDILSFLRKQGEGYEDQINAVLRDHVDALRKEHR